MAQAGSRSQEVAVKIGFCHAVVLAGGLAGLFAGEVLAQTSVARGDSGTIDYPIENVTPSDGPFEGVTVSVISIDPEFANYVTTTTVAAQDIAVGQTATFSIPYKIAANAPDGTFSMVLHIDMITVGSTPDLTDSSRDATVRFNTSPPAFLDDKTAPLVS
jgi:hypothetical protein